MEAISLSPRRLTHPPACSCLRRETEVRRHQSSLRATHKLRGNPARQPGLAGMIGLALCYVPMVLWADSFTFQIFLNLFSHPIEGETVLAA